MGITRGSARLLFEESKRRPFSGSVLELGKMFVFLTDRELEHWSERHHLLLDHSRAAELSHDPVLAAHRCIDDRTFFRRLGFSEVQSLDAAPWEGADIIHDLNQPVPEQLHGRFDVIFEGGTLQNVFHVVQCLENIHRLLADGGRIIHSMTASHNQVDLGFYMFSPTFFHDFYTANGWQLEKLYLCEHTSFWADGKLVVGPFDVYDYEPGAIDHLSYGRYGHHQLTIFAVATKTAASSSDVIPFQSYYQRLWNEDRKTRLLEQEHRAKRVARWRPIYSSWPYKRFKFLTEALRRRGFFRDMPEKLATY